MDQIVAAEKPHSPRRDYAQQLADEMKTLVPGMERLAEIATELRADDLYRLLGFGTWDEFCIGYLGVSKRTANRWIAGPKPAIKAVAAKTETAGESAVAGHSVPLSDADALKSANTPPTAPIESDPVVAFAASEGVEQDGETRSAPRVRTPSDPTPEGDGRPSPQAISGNPPPEPSPSGAVKLLVTDVGELGDVEMVDVELYFEDDVPCVLCGVVASDGPPTAKEEAQAVYSAIINATEGIGKNWTPEQVEQIRERIQAELNAARPANGGSARPAQPKPERPVRVVATPPPFQSFTRTQVTPIPKKAKAGA